MAPSLSRVKYERSNGNDVMGTTVLPCPSHWFHSVSLVFFPVADQVLLEDKNAPALGKLESMA